MQHPAPLGIASSLTVLALDWLLFAQVSALPASAPQSTLVVALLAVLCVYLSERREAGQEFAPRWMRGLGAGIAVAIPLPVYGTLLATLFVVWTCTMARERRGPSLSRLPAEPTLLRTGERG